MFIECVAPQNGKSTRNVYYFEKKEKNKKKKKTKQKKERVTKMFKKKTDKRSL